MDGFDEWLEGFQVSESEIFSMGTKLDLRLAWQAAYRRGFKAAQAKGAKLIRDMADAEDDQGGERDEALRGAALLVDIMPLHNPPKEGGT